MSARRRDSAPPGPKRATLVVAAAAVSAALLLSGCSSFFGQILGLPQPIPAPDADFEAFGEQEPRWVPCGGGAMCADVYAPLDWDDLDGERITLRLAKHPAAGGDPLGTLFVNTGGPGAAGASDVRDYVDGLVTREVREKYDVIGWDPRGVGDSSSVRCLDDRGLDEYLYGTGDPQEDGAFLEPGSDPWIDLALQTSAEFGQACQQRTGALLGQVDTLSTVRDLDMLRDIVDDARLNYLGYSYGTRIGALYADEYPARSGRLVLDGAMDPAADLAEISRQQVVGIEGALRAYVEDCLKRSGCPLDGTAEQAMRRIGDLLARIGDRPIRADDGRMLYDSTLFTALVAPLYSQERWPEIDTLIRETSNGSAEQAFRLADGYNDRTGDGAYRSNLTEAFTAINCVDYPRAARPDIAAMRADAAETIALAPVTGRFQTFGELACAGWPAPAVDVTRTVSAAGADPILVVGTTGDPATPYRWAESLAGQLESGVLVTFDGEGHTAYGESRCIDDIVDRYLLEGAVPAASSARCSV